MCCESQAEQDLDKEIEKHFTEAELADPRLKVHKHNKTYLVFYSTERGRKFIKRMTLDEICKRFETTGYISYAIVDGDLVKGFNDRLDKNRLK